MEAFLILGALVGLLVLRVPVAFALGGLGVVLLWLKDLPLVGVPQRLYGTMDSFELLAVPMFLLMSNVLLKGGVGRDLFAAVQSWVGHWPGGLGVATIKSCTLFSAISGSSVVAARFHLGDGDCADGCGGGARRAGDGREQGAAFDRRHA